MSGKFCTSVIILFNNSGIIKSKIAAIIASTSKTESKSEIGLVALPSLDVPSFLVKILRSKNFSGTLNIKANARPISIGVKTESIHPKKPKTKFIFCRPRNMSIPIAITKISILTFFLFNSINSAPKSL